AVHQCGHTRGTPGRTEGAVGTLEHPDVHRLDVHAGGILLLLLAQIRADPRHARLADETGGRCTAQPHPETMCHSLCDRTVFFAAGWAGLFLALVRSAEADAARPIEPHAGYCAAEGQEIKKTPVLPGIF